MTWHVSDVTNLIISTESVKAANIEVQLETCGSSLIKNRSDTRTSVVLYKFAKVPWLKLCRDDTVIDAGLQNGTLRAQLTAIENMDSEEERQTRREKKKGSLGLDEPAQVLRAPAVSSSGATQHLSQRYRSLQRSAEVRSQHSARDSVEWSAERAAQLTPAQAERKAQGKSLLLCPNHVRARSPKVFATVAAIVCALEPPMIFIPQAARQRTYLGD